METLNLTNPGQAPVNGDRIKIIHDNGTEEIKTFYDPDPAPPDPAQIIDRAEFWDRFTDIEQETIADSTNSKAKKFLVDLRMRDLVDLTSTRLQDTLTQMESAGVIGPGRAAEIGA